MTDKQKKKENLFLFFEVSQITIIIINALLYSLAYSLFHLSENLPLFRVLTFFCRNIYIHSSR